MRDAGYEGAAPERRGGGKASANGSLLGGWPVRGMPLISVLELDPDLRTGVPQSDLACATAAAAARAVDLGPGRCPFEPQQQTGGLGLLLISGVILIEVRVGQRTHADVLTGGDVLLPWLADESGASVGSSLGARVIRPARVALLDRAFALRTARWPEITSNVLGRVVARARRLSMQAAVNAMPRIQDRIELTLWLLADRFGNMTPEGAVVELPLTHAHLAEVIGCQRPSVTSALSALQAAGRLEVVGPRTWRLCERPDSLEELAAATPAPT